MDERPEAEKTNTSPANLEKIQNALDFLENVRRDLKVVDDNVDRRSRGKFVDFRDTVAHPETETEPVDQCPLETTVENDSIPRQIGRFEIRHVLGEGGFSKVFLAHDPVLERPVALKVLKSSRSFSDDALNRFQREARAAAVLNHPNIVPVFDSGYVHGERFIASAYTEAETLQRWFRNREKSIAPKTAAVIVATLADAIEHAHCRGVVHRDLKPANVLVQIDQRETESQRSTVQDMSADIQPEKLQITDFGLSRLKHSGDQWQTAEGAIVGTPAYMSPEQAAGLADITIATDIYSLGVMLYELLTGKLPILGTTHIGTLLAISKELPKPPRNINRSVPRDLQAICMKCLEKSPTARYTSAHQLAVDLRRWMNGDVVGARNPNAIERLAKWVSRHPAITFAFVGITLALMLSIVQWQRASAENARAQRNIDLASDTIRDLVAKTSRVSSIPPEIRRELTERAVQLQTRLLKDDDGNEKVIFQTALAWQQLAIVLVDLREYEDSIDAFDQSQALVKTVLQSEATRTLIAENLNWKARNLSQLGRNEEALQELELHPENEQSAIAMANHLDTSGVILLEKNEPGSALIEFEKARILRRSQGVNGIFAKGGMANTLRNIGLAHLDLGETNAAIQVLEESLRLQLDMAAQVPFHEIVNDMTGKIRRALGTAYYDANQFSDAKKQLQGAVELFEALAEWNPQAARFYVQGFSARNELANLLQETGAWDEFGDNLDRMNEQFKKIDFEVTEYRKFGEWLFHLKVNLAENYFSDEQPTEGEEELESARQLLHELENIYRDDPTGIQELKNRLN